jgi:hypothetical protein
MVGGDERAVSESAGVTILIGMTLIVTASVGVSVLFVQDGDSGGPTANFTFSGDSGSTSMIVIFKRGDSFPAGDITVEAGSNRITWAELANSPANQTIGPGDAIQLSSSSAWGQPLRRGQTIEIYHAPGGGNRTLLDSWSG